MCWSSGNRAEDVGTTDTIDKAANIDVKSVSATRAFLAQQRKGKSLGYAGSFLNQKIGG